MNNIFKFGIYRHTPKYWFSNIAQFFRNIKYAFQRATRGFADPDWWEFDTFVATILRDGCRELATKHYGCPSGIGGRNAEESSKRWEDILNETADCFNSYLDKDFLTIPDNAETASDYLEVFAESCRVAEEEYLHGIEMLKDWHSHLWD